MDSDSRSTEAAAGRTPPPPPAVVPAPTARDAVLVRLARILEEMRVPYIVTGDAAVSVWGGPRVAQDVTVLVWAGQDDRERIVGRLTMAFPATVSNPGEFARRTRVLALEGADDVPIEIVFGLFPVEAEAIGRALPVWLSDHLVQFCAPEDLILERILSTEERDLADARAIVLRRHAHLDRALIESRVVELAEGLDRPDILARWNAWTAETHGADAR